MTAVGLTSLRSSGPPVGRKSWACKGDSTDKLGPSRLVTSAPRDTGGLQKELVLFTTHADPHTPLAQDSEQLKEVIQQEPEGLWVWLLPVLPRRANGSVTTCLKPKGDWRPMLTFNN